MGHDDPIREQAAAWAVRTGDPAFDDWDGFTAWLEQHPAHAEAYDRVMAAVADAAEADIPVLAPANDEAIVAETPGGAASGAWPAVKPSFSSTRRRWLGGAIAASLAVVAFAGLWQMRGGGSETFETAPGETRLIALADGGQIAMSGGTRLVVDPDEPREARLEAGQALFTIDHDPSAPFRLEVGEDTLVDVGTVFDVAHGPDSLRVAVSDGAVLFNPSGQNVELLPGDMLSSKSGSDEYSLARIPLEQVGEWRSGRLTFQDASLEELAGDLTRTTGIGFRTAPGAAGKTVSGSLLLDPVRDDPRSIGPLLGVSVRRQGDGWVIDTP